MAAVTVVCTMPEARALYAALVQCADALVDDSAGPPRIRGQRMVDALLDLVLRPGTSGLPPVRVLLTVVASIGTLLGGDAPGEVDGGAGAGGDGPPAGARRRRPRPPSGST
jgi:hypothetical protein